MLVTDLPASDILITQLFTTFFDILSGTSKSSTGEQIAKSVCFNMTAILVTLVDESNVIPQEAVDIIVAQFLRADPRVVGAVAAKNKKSAAATVDDKQSTLVMKELPPAYSMAKTICNQCPEKMAREVSKYFNDVIKYAFRTSTIFCLNNFFF